MNHFFVRLAFPSALVVIAIALSAGPIGCSGATEQDVLSTTVGSGTTQSSSGSAGTSGTSGTGTSSGGQTSGGQTSGQTSGGTSSSSSSGTPPAGCTSEKEPNDTEGSANAFVQPCMVGAVGDSSDLYDDFYFDVTTQTSYSLSATTSSGKVILQIKSPLSDWHDFQGGDKLVPGRWYIRLEKGTTGSRAVSYQTNFTMK